MYKALIAGVTAIAVSGCSNLKTEDVLIGTAVIGAVAAAGYYANKQDKKQKAQEEDKKRQQGQTIVASNGRCWDLAGGRREGAQLQLWDCHGGDNQRFRYDNGQLKSGDLCLDVEGGNGNNGSRVIAYRCHGGRNQQWSLGGDQVRTRLNNRCVDVEGGRGNNGTRLIVWDCHGGANQRFAWR